MPSTVFTKKSLQLYALYHVFWRLRNQIRAIGSYAKDTHQRYNNMISYNANQMQKLQKITKQLLLSA